MSRIELKNILNITEEELSDLINGKFPIDDDMAHKLSQSLGSTPQFWIVREYHYRQKLFIIEKIINDLERYE